MKLIVIFSLAFLSFNSLTQVDILFENFDNTTLPANWTIIDNDGNTPAADVSEYTEAWIYKEDPLNPGNGTASSTSYFDPIDRADRWLITPQMTLGAVSNYISWKALSHDPSFPDSYKVMISTTSNDIGDFTDTLQVISSELPEWTSRVIELDEYANQTVYIAFVNTTFDGFKLYLDSIYVREQDPLNLDDLALENKKTYVYPNPVVDELTISGDSILEISVQSFTGAEMYSSSEVFAGKISMTSYPAGVYFVTVRLNDGSIERHKILKK